MSSNDDDTWERTEKEGRAPLKLPDLFQKRNTQFNDLISKPLSKAFSIFEEMDPAIPVTLQLLLSEAVEQIRGILIPKSVLFHRAFLACFERAKVLYSLFESLFANLNHSQGATFAASGISSIEELTNLLWGGGFQELVRPGMICKPFEIRNISKGVTILSSQIHVANKIAKMIESDPRLVSSLKSIPILSQEDVLQTGLTGPLKRAAGLISSRPKRDPPYPVKSIEFIYQYALSSSYNPVLWHAYRICYGELYLALNRLVFLLKEYDPTMSHPDSNSLRTAEGDATIFLPSPLGHTYLTLGLYEDRVQYLNYISSQIKNWKGFTRILTKFEETNQKLIMPLFNPVVVLNGI
ncbi:MAG: hypothetical protein ACFFE8_04295 [Candidatus Heimdallarchaeota archaeon]